MITSKEKSQLRGKAHLLKPIVIVGQHGLTENVLKEIELVLYDHELIKVKLHGSDQKQMVKKICDHCQANHVQTIGHIATIYRQRDENTK